MDTRCLGEIYSNLPSNIAKNVESSGNIFSLMIVSNQLGQKFQQVYYLLPTGCEYK